MGSIYRPTIIRYLDSQGRRVPKGTPGARRVRQKSKTYWGRCADETGEVRPVALCDDAEAAETMLAELKQRAKRIARGDVDPFEKHRKRPLADHLKEFEEALLAKEATDKQAQQVASRCRKIINGCGFQVMAELSPSAVAAYLRDRRQEGLSIQTSNHYLAAIKSFANWLVKDRRMSTNPLAHMEKLNADVDLRHERRALTPDELVRLVQAATRSQTVFRGLDGATRAMLYRLAAMTGLRANELASLTTASFDLDLDPPTVTIAAGYSKRRRRDILPLHPDLVAQLRQWLSDREHGTGGYDDILSFDQATSDAPANLFPGTWPEKGAKMFYADLDEARARWLAEVEDNPTEFKQRSATTFLCPVDDTGRVADFHGLRHTFISNLAAGGAHPKVAQQLARHSSITLTMDRYSHLGLIDMMAGLASLPSIGEPDSQTMRATGTTDRVLPTDGCTNGCTRPVQPNRFQPISAVANDAPTTNEKTHVSPQKTQENTGNLVVHPAGLEPATFGSVDRCSIQLS